jgi:hypothetical protein
MDILALPSPARSCSLQRSSRKLKLTSPMIPRGNTMATLNLRFAFEKETKGAVRFQEVGEDGKPAFALSIGTLYIGKSALPDGKIPQTLTVTITI